MRISDWSSDVCSSDLRGVVVGRSVQRRQPRRPRADRRRRGVGPCPTPEPPGFRLRAGTRGSGAMRMLASAIALAIAAPASAQSLAIVHAEAWTMEGDTPVHDATILVDGSRILSVKAGGEVPAGVRSEEHTSELQSLMRSSYGVFCLKKKNRNNIRNISP